MDNIYAFREAYDILRGMEPDRDYRGKATVTTSIREDGTRTTRVCYLDDDAWEKELAKELVFPDGLSVSMEELAMHCLWEITFYGFSPAGVKDTFPGMLGRQKPQNRYGAALDKLKESIWRRQTPRKFRLRGEGGERLITGWFAFERCGRRMNRAKRKRKYRQNRRIKYLATMSRRETLIQTLTVQGSTFTRSDVEFLLGVDYGMRYDYYSVGCGTNGRLDYILESMTKYQQLDLARYDNAVVFVLYPSRYPLEDLEVEAFRKAVHKRLGYENVMFGTAVTSSEKENVKVMLLLNRTA